MYDDLAYVYDMMTDFDNRWFNRDYLWNDLLDKYKPKKVLDFGCGSGFNAIVLGNLGLEVIGIDSSKEMIKRANSNLKQYSEKSNVKFITGNLDNILDFRGELNWVLCFGNTLAHFSVDELISFLTISYNALKPGGILWIQLLNYHKILKEKKRLINVTGDNNNTFIRFYDFLEDGVKFNIIRLKGDKLDSEWFSNKLNPVTSDQIRSTFDDLGLFTSIDFYSDLRFNPYILDSSNNLTILAYK